MFRSETCVFGLDFQSNVVRQYVSLYHISNFFAENCCFDSMRNFDVFL